MSLIVKPGERGAVFDMEVPVKKKGERYKKEAMEIAAAAESVYQKHQAAMEAMPEGPQKERAKTALEAELVILNKKREAAKNAKPAPRPRLKIEAAYEKLLNETLPEGKKVSLEEMEPLDRAMTLFCLAESSKCVALDQRNRYAMMMCCHDYWNRAVTQPISCWRGNFHAFKMRNRTIREMDKGGLAHLIAMAEERANAAEALLLAAQMKAAEAEARAAGIIVLLKAEKANRVSSEANLRKDRDQLKVKSFQQPVHAYFDKWEFTQCMRLVVVWKFNIIEDQAGSKATVALRAAVKAAKEEVKRLHSAEELKYLIECRYLEDVNADQKWDRKRAMIISLATTYTLIKNLNENAVILSFLVWKTIIDSKRALRASQRREKEIEISFQKLAEDRENAIATAVQTKQVVMEKSKEVEIVKEEVVFYADKLGDKVKESTVQLGRLKQVADLALEQSKKAKKTALNAQVEKSEAVLGNKLAMDVVEVQRVALEESIQEERQYREAYQEMKLALSKVEKETGQLDAFKENIRPELIETHQNILDVFKILEPNGSAGREDEVAASSEVEIATRNHALLEQILRKLRMKRERSPSPDRRDPLNHLEEVTHVDMHADKAHRSTPPRRPQTQGGVSLKQVPITGTLPISNPRIQQAMSNPSALFNSPSGLNNSPVPAPATWGRARSTRGKIGAIGAITGALPSVSGNRVAPRTVDDWAKHATNSKPKIDRIEVGGDLAGLKATRPLPPITPELEPPITP